MQEPTLDELDRRIVHALQVHPRVPWARLAPILGVDAVTLARRWDAMVADRTVWSSAYTVRSSAGAFVEIEAEPGHVLGLARQLCADAEAFTVDVTAGGRDLVVTVVTSDEDALARYLLGRLGPMPGVRRISSSPFAVLLTEASRWRLRALSPTEVDGVTRTLPAGHPTAARPGHHRRHDHNVAVLLAHDARIAATEVADRLDISPSAARAALGRLVAHGRVRVDVQRSQTGWPVYAWLTIRVPSRLIETVASRLAGLPEVRVVASVVGPYTIVAAVWVRSLDDVLRLEGAIEEQVDGVRVMDRSPVLQTLKLAGNLLGPDGRRTGYVPLSVYAP